MYYIPKHKRRYSNKWNISLLSTTGGSISSSGVAVFSWLFLGTSILKIGLCIPVSGLTYTL